VSGFEEFREDGSLAIRNLNHCIFDPIFAGIGRIFTFARQRRGISMANLGPELSGTHEDTLAGDLQTTRSFRPWESRPDAGMGLTGTATVRALALGPKAPALALRETLRPQVTGKFPAPDRERVNGSEPARLPDVLPGAAADATGMGRVMGYLSEHFRENVPMKALADLVRLSLRQFHRNFKKHFGMPPNQYLIRMRVTAARDMLVSDKRPVAKIAYDLGFADDTLFIRQFKARMGMTPLQYRKANR
jgi:AraC-like DNA-binding protein